MEVGKIFESPISTRIVRFFRENPSSVDTAKGIATWTGLELGLVKKELESLVKAKVLIAHRTSSTVGYALTNDNGLISKIDEHLNKVSD